MLPDQRKEIRALKSALRETRYRAYQFFNVQRQRELLARQREAELTERLVAERRSSERLRIWLEAVVSAIDKLLNGSRSLRKSSSKALEEFVDEYRTWAGEHPQVSSSKLGLPLGRIEDTDEALQIPYLTPTVDVVIAVDSDHPLEVVHACLQSVAGKSPRLNHIVLVDNGVDERISQYLEAFASESVCPVTIRKCPGPPGSSKGINQGLRAAHGDYVIVLSSSTLVSHDYDWIQNLLFCGEHDPSTGLIGPLSTELPRGLSADDAAFRLALTYPPRFPRASQLDGCCLVIKRRVIDKIGPFDEEAFPDAVGGVADLCRRAADAGFTLRVADNACVFRAGGIEKTESAMGEAPKLAQAREDFSRALKKGPPSFKVLFLMWFRGGGGGAHSIVQEAMGLRRLGVYAQLAIRQADEAFYRENYPQAPADLFFSMTADGEVVLIARAFDLVIATLFTTMKTLRLVKALNPGITTGYYIQDYEPWFVEEGSDLHREALASYEPMEGLFHFAKTEWLCRTVEERHRIRVHKVTPSIDTDVYYAPAKGRPDTDPMVVTAMVRPQTPRRSPELTVSVLRRLKLEFRDAVEIAVFGCETSDPFWETVPTDFKFSNRGVLTRDEVAGLLREATVFLDLSTYQAFGRTGLEAMACGCATILPEKGGTHEYAKHGENTLLVDTADEVAILEAARAILGDAVLRKRIQEAALKTAANYSILKAAKSEKTLFEERLAIARSYFSKVTL